jgi:hypothetical protein
MSIEPTPASTTSGAAAKLQAGKLSFRSRTGVPFVATVGAMVIAFCWPWQPSSAPRDPGADRSATFTVARGTRRRSSAFPGQNLPDGQQQAAAAGPFPGLRRPDEWGFRPVTLAELKVRPARPEFASTASALPRAVHVHVSEFPPCALPRAPDVHTPWPNVSAASGRPRPSGSRPRPCVLRHPGPRRTGAASASRMHARPQPGIGDDGVQTR